MKNIRHYMTKDDVYVLTKMEANELTERIEIEAQNIAAPHHANTGERDKRYIPQFPRDTVKGRIGSFQVDTTHGLLLPYISRLFQPEARIVSERIRVDCPNNPEFWMEIELAPLFEYLRKEEGYIIVSNEEHATFVPPCQNCKFVAPGYGHAKRKFFDDAKIPKSDEK